MQTNWYETSFHGLALEFWRNVVTTEQTSSEADFIEAELGVPAGSQILDMPCGNGRHSVELAKRGHTMTAVDLSTECVA